MTNKETLEERSLRQEREEYEAQTHDRTPPSPADDSSPVPDSDTLSDELAKQKDDYRRLAADFDNFRKRTRRDTVRDAASEKEAFIGEILPVLDNLERALASEPPSLSGALHHGVTLILQQLEELLRRHGIEVVEDLGQPFDPHRHDAVTLQSDPRQSDQIILEVIQCGYARGDHVFRPAKVIVNDLRHPSGGLHAV